MEEDISARAKEIEAKLKGGPALDKKPKDLLRAIGINIVVYFKFVIILFVLNKIIVSRKNW